ncbi:MAG: hypothetical protein ACYC6L_01535 [Anaerolineae bacterium]
MTTYTYGRIRNLNDQLIQAAVPDETRAAIMAGGEGVKNTASPLVKSDWLRGAMLRMEALLDNGTRIAVREGCACCLGGKRAEITRQISKLATFDERLAAAKDAHYVFGHDVSQLPDGRIEVLFAPEGQPPYRCVCLGKEVQEPISLTYCQCCGGHIKHHLQNALGVRLTCEPQATALSTAQAEPCRFWYTIVA